MTKLNEIVPIQLTEKTSPTEKTPPSATNKLALRLRNKDGNEILIYNGVNNYILQAILKEWCHDAS